MPVIVLETEDTAHPPAQKGMRLSAWEYSKSSSETFPIYWQ